MFRRIAEKASSFRRDARGVVLVLFAVLIMPILLLTAVAIDFSQFLVMKQQLVAAVDAAALDLGRSPDLTDAQASEKAQSFVDANFPAGKAIGTLQPVTVVRSKDTIDITATASMNTSFLKLAGYDTLSVTVHSQSSIKENKLEVVLVLDNTGSMADRAGASTKIDGLKTAATGLTNILFGSNDASEYVKVGVVPFTAAVNVGPQYASAAWIDGGGKGALTRENLDVPLNKSLFDLFNGLTNATWRGCVRQRPEPYDTSDMPPTLDPSVLPDTLFTPYFAPSEPKGTLFWNNRWYYFWSGGWRSSANNYLSDGSASGSWEDIQRSVAKYAGGSVANGMEGPNYLCPVKPILRLTNQKQPVLDEIDGMSPYGNTVIPAGLMWGWHLISPNFWPFAAADQIAPYTDEDTIKAIVLVTDGDNNVSSGSNGFNGSYFSAYGYANAGGHLKVYPALSPEGNLDQKLLSLCGNIKAIKNKRNTDRIILYMIALGNDINSNSKRNLQQCATDSTTYFTTSTTDELITAFKKIAIGLNQLRISQ
jgi:Flp pilus assembly protein TadG